MFVKLPCDKLLSLLARLAFAAAAPASRRSQRKLIFRVHVEHANRRAANVALSRNLGLDYGGATLDWPIHGLSAFRIVPLPGVCPSGCVKSERNHQAHNEHQEEKPVRFFLRVLGDYIII